MNLTLKYLLLIRVFAIGGQAVALYLMQHVFGIDVPIIPVVVILGALTLFTFVSRRRLRRIEPIDQNVFVVQLLADIAALTFLIYYTGGPANPFTSLFLLPIVFAAAAISAGYTTLITLAAVCSYTLLMFFHRPIAQHHQDFTGVELHVWGMWYGFVLSAACVALFVARIARALREHDRALATAREEVLKSERMVTLGALAAGTAHELGTPLSTMAVIARELETDLAGDAQAMDSLRLLREQLARCKEILARLSSDTGQLQAGDGHQTTIPDYLDKLVSDWRRLRPEVDVRYEKTGPEQAPEIIADQTLSQAILNILNNAADATSEIVEVAASWNSEKIILEVSDQGPGIASDVHERLGDEVMSTKRDRGGIGIGLFLATSTLQRIGGRIDLDNTHHGGVRARIEIPIAPLSATT